MIKLVILVLLVLAVVALVALVRSARTGQEQRASADAELRHHLSGLALDRLDVSPVLAAAVLRVPVERHDYVDEVLRLALEHRESDPELSTVLIDEIRTARRGPRGLD